MVWDLSITEIADDSRITKECRFGKHPFAGDKNTSEQVSCVPAHSHTGTQTAVSVRLMGNGGSHNTDRAAASRCAPGLARRPDPLVARCDTLWSAHTPVRGVHNSHTLTGCLYTSVHSHTANEAP